MNTTMKITVAATLVAAFVAPALADEQVETLANSGRFYQTLDPLLAQQSASAPAMSYAQAPTPAPVIGVRPAARPAPTLRQNSAEELWFARAAGHLD